MKKNILGILVLFFCCSMAFVSDRMNFDKADESGVGKYKIDVASIEDLKKEVEKEQFMAFSFVEKTERIVSCGVMNVESKELSLPMDGITFVASSDRMDIGKAKVDKLTKIILSRNFRGTFKEKIKMRKSTYQDVEKVLGKTKSDYKEVLYYSKKGLMFTFDKETKMLSEIVIRSKKSLF